jgi:hypothetical protein
MAAVPTGTLFSVATTFGSTITVTAVTNANPAVCTATAHGLSNGDIIEFTSGWGRANKRVFRVANQATNTFELEGFDTSSTSFFPAGTGIGTVREVTAWTQLTKVMNPATQGGDPKTVTYKFVESDVEYSINDGFTAVSYTLEFDDDDTTSGYTAMRTLTDAQTDTVMKMLMRSGAVVYLPCTLAMNDVPRLQDGQINRINAQFAGNNRHTRYSA